MKNTGGVGEKLPHLRATATKKIEYLIIEEDHAMVILFVVSTSKMV